MSSTAAGSSSSHSSSSFLLASLLTVLRAPMQLQITRQRRTGFVYQSGARRVRARTATTRQHANTPTRTHTDTHTRQHANIPTRTHAKTHTRQHVNTPTRQHANTPTRTDANTPTLQHANTPTRQHASTPARQHARSSDCRPSSSSTFVNYRRRTRVRTYLCPTTTQTKQTLLET